MNLCIFALCERCTNNAVFVQTVVNIHSCAATPYSPGPSTRHPRESRGEVERFRCMGGSKSSRSFTSLSGASAKGVLLSFINVIV